MLPGESLGEHLVVVLGVLPGVGLGEALGVLPGEGLDEHPVGVLGVLPGVGLGLCLGEFLDNLHGVVLDERPGEALGVLPGEGLDEHPVGVPGVLPGVGLGLCLVEFLGDLPGVVLDERPGVVLVLAILHPVLALAFLGLGLVLRVGVGGLPGEGLGVLAVVDLLGLLFLLVAPLVRCGVAGRLVAWHGLSLLVLVREAAVLHLVPVPGDQGSGNSIFT